MSRRIGIDTGGTFTDFVALDAGSLVVHKLRSTPSDPSRVILSGIEQLTKGRSAEDIVHGSTVATMPAPTQNGSVFESEFGLGAFPPSDYLLEITADAKGDVVKKVVAIRVTGS